MNYNNKKFRAVTNSEFGETTEETVFLYFQSGAILKGTYSGGSVIKGQLLGSVSVDGTIDMCYHQINTKGELKSGICKSIPEILSNGKVRLHESWKWTSGGTESGNSIIEEF